MQYLSPAVCLSHWYQCRQTHVFLTNGIHTKFIHSPLHRRCSSTMGRSRPAFRRFPCNVLYQTRIRIVDLDGMVRYVRGQAVVEREIDWCCKDIFDYCRFFFVRSAEDVTIVQCKRCSRRITRRLGWRLLRNHLVDCVGTDFREQFKE